MRWTVALLATCLVIQPPAAAQGATVHWTIPPETSAKYTELLQNVSSAFGVDTRNIVLTDRSLAARADADPSGSRVVTLTWQNYNGSRGMLATGFHSTQDPAVLSVDVASLQPTIIAGRPDQTVLIIPNANGTHALDIESAASNLNLPRSAARQDVAHIEKVEFAPGVPTLPRTILLCPNCTEISIAEPGFGSRVNTVDFFTDAQSTIRMILLHPWVDVSNTSLLPRDVAREKVLAGGGRGLNNLTYQQLELRGEDDSLVYVWRASPNLTIVQDALTGNVVRSESITVAPGDRMAPSPFGSALAIVAVSAYVAIISRKR